MAPTSRAAQVPDVKDRGRFSRASTSPRDPSASGKDRRVFLPRSGVGRLLVPATVAGQSEHSPLVHLFLTPIFNTLIFVLKIVRVSDAAAGVGPMSTSDPSALASPSTLPLTRPGSQLSTVFDHPFFATAVSSGREPNCQRRISASHSRPHMSRCIPCVTSSVPR